MDTEKGKGGRERERTNLQMSGSTREDRMLILTIFTTGVIHGPRGLSVDAASELLDEAEVVVARSLPLAQVLREALTAEYFLPR